jgi:hypothetical protein
MTETKIQQRRGNSDKQRVEVAKKEKPRAVSDVSGR